MWYFVCLLVAILYVKVFFHTDVVYLYFYSTGLGDGSVVKIKPQVWFSALHKTDLVAHILSALGIGSECI